ncbi:MAG: hypothetical protein J7497_16380 [Chitinophagaceae bacterium]|nr:hypothetical protein [Chitinophagaceae bacterium]
MKIKYLIFLVLLFHTACYAQLMHTDQMEYGYKGPVRVIVKKTYANPIPAGNELTFRDSNQVTIHTYYFNRAGNMDSAKMERKDPLTGDYSYMTYFEFNKSRKSGWNAFDENNEKLMVGEIAWSSDKEFTENVYVEGQLRYEVKTVLNNSFRIIETNVRSFGEDGDVLQEDKTEFKFDESGDIDYKTAHQKSGLEEKTIYVYFSKDRFGNPTKLKMTKGNTAAKTLVVIDYLYYN